jgi:hypothetical protein
MRMIMFVTLPVEPFNAAVKDGSAGAKMKKILDHVKPEAAYFIALQGKRTAVLIVDLPDASKIPSLSEPWFLTFDAAIEAYPLMLPADLAAAGLDSIGKEWA